MHTLIVEISYTGNNFAAYVPILPGCVATGATPAEIQQNIADAITFHIEGSLADGDPLPKEVKGKYSLQFLFNIESLLKYYRGIFTHAAFERITGISQAQISHYATGRKKPRGPQINKIETALHDLGSELLSVKIQKNLPVSS